jgi:hypothetical protein
MSRVIGRVREPNESKAIDKLVARLKDNLDDGIGARLHYIRNLGWLYESPLFDPQPIEQ